MDRGILKAKEERRLLRGHLWAYRNEFESLPDLEDGALIDVVSAQGRFVGRGYFQAAGGIAVRILTREPHEIDAEFIKRRIDRAKAFREGLYPGETVYRWVYGESDGLPGLVADRYGPLIVARTSSRFYASVVDRLADAFLSHEGTKGVVVRVGDDTFERGIVEAPVECSVNNLSFSIDPKTSQKTGMFLDQRENWKLAQRYACGGTVLDGHCYTGAWGLHAAAAGAERVLGVDTSSSAIETARSNAERNGLSAACSFEAADIQDVLARGETWDTVILDPPALARSRGHLKKALGLYQALNRDAMKVLKPGGILITSSCSQPLDAAAFIEVLKRAAGSARRPAQLLDTRGAAPDHPTLLAMPETHYLTCAVLRIL